MMKFASDGCDIVAGGERRRACRMALERALLGDGEQARIKLPSGRAGVVAWHCSSVRSAGKKRGSGSCRQASNYTAPHYTTPTRRPFARLSITTTLLVDVSCSGRACHESLAANGVTAFRSRTTPVLRGAERSKSEIRVVWQRQQHSHTARPRDLLPHIESTSSSMPPLHPRTR